MLSFLPQDEGWLPSWLLLVSTISIANTVQAYLTTVNTAQVYAASPTSINPLSSRIFGTWTFLSAVIRFYAAYNISNPQIYQLAFWAYGLAWAHFMSEWLVFGTAKMGKGLIGPVCISTGSLVWMVGQWGFYVQ